MMIVAAANQTLNRMMKIVLVIASSSTVGKVLKIAIDNRLSMPLVPRSITRDSPPVLRSR